MPAGPGPRAATGEDAGSPAVRPRPAAGEAAGDAVVAAVEAARGGEGGALVVTGPPGSGRSRALALRTDLTATVLRCAGTTAEATLPGAGLHRLLHPVAGRAAALPERQREAIGRALGETPGEPEPFALGAGLLALLESLARADRPVVCAVDDADRLDPLSLGTLAFAARRAGGTRLALLLAGPEPRPGTAWDAALTGLPRFRLEPLTDACARTLVTALLSRRFPGPVPEEVVVGIADRGRGNPLALHELAAAVTGAQLGGLAPLAEGLPPGSRLRRHHAETIEALTPGPRAALLLVAAAGRIELDPLLRACAEAGAGAGDLGALRAEGLVGEDAGGRLRVPDRLFRASVLAAADLGARTRAHRSLAAVLDHERARAARAWHRAAAAAAPTEELAGELREAASAATAAGDHGTASRCLERSAQLTTTPGAAGDRLVEAARSAWHDGDGPRARILLGEARPLAATPELRGMVDLLRGEIEMRAGTAERAYDALSDVAGGLTGPRRTQAVLGLLRAGEVLMLAGDHRRFLGLAHRIAALPPPAADDPPETRLLFRLFAGVAASLVGDHRGSVAALRELVELGPVTRDPSALVLSTIAAITLGDEMRAHAFAAQAVAQARAIGGAQLPVALEFLAFADFWRDDHRSAAQHAREALRLARAAGQQNTVATTLGILAMTSTLTGDDGGVALGQAKDATGEARGRGLRRPAALTTWAVVRQALAEGRPEDAGPSVRALDAAWPNGMHETIQVMATPDLVEAAVHLGDRPFAERLLGTFDAWAEGVASPSMQALGARSRALLEDDEDRAQQLFDSALRLHGTRNLEFERARTQLLYGRALRRRRRPGAAREHLHDALGGFERLEARPWTERARAELRAAGGSTAPGADAPAAQPAAERLTPQQYEIARLVAAGATNREVAAQLFLSPRTVDHHLRNVFVRLGVRSRVELARRLD